MNGSYPMPSPGEVTFDRVELEEWTRLNRLLHALTVKAVPNTVMLAIDREAHCDGVAAWTCLRSTHDDMTDEELSSLASVITKPSQVSNKHRVLAKIDTIHEANAILAAYERPQPSSDVRVAIGSSKGPLVPTTVGLAVQLSN